LRREGKGVEIALTMERAERENREFFMKELFAGSIVITSKITIKKQVIPFKSPANPPAR
jgi:hypothetical protein